MQRDRFPGSWRGRVGTYLISRATYVFPILILGWLAVCPWVRPPISKDIRGTQSILSFNQEKALGASDGSLNFRGRSEFCFDSPGGLLVLVCGVGVILILISQRFAPVVTTSVFAVSIFASCFSTVGMPKLYDTLEVESLRSTNLNTILSCVSTEMFFVSSPQRPESLAPWNAPKARRTMGERRTPKWLGFPIPSHSVLIGALYQRASQLTMIGACLFFAWTSSQNQSLRFTHFVFAVLLGVAACLCFSWSPLEGMRLRQRAIELTSRNELELAKIALRDANRKHPSIKSCRQTLLTQGELDHLRGVDSDESRLYRSHYYYLRRQLPEAVHELSLVSSSFENDWYAVELLSDIHVLRGITALRAGIPQDAEASFLQAIAISPKRIDACVGLCVAENQNEKDSADTVLLRLSPWIEEVASPTLKSDLYSICGQAFENEGQHDLARKYFRLAYDVIRMPRHVSHFAEEGLLGF